MKIVTRIVDATRFLICLSNLQKGNKPVKLMDMQVPLNNSLSWIEFVVREIREADLITARRGPGGGYHLVRPLSEITLGDIARAVDKEYNEVHELLRSSYDAMVAHMDTIKLSDLAEADNLKVQQGERSVLSRERRTYRSSTQAA